MDKNGRIIRATFLRFSDVGEECVVWSKQFVNVKLDGEIESENSNITN